MSLNHPAWFPLKVNMNTTLSQSELDQPHSPRPSKASEGGYCVALIEDQVIGGTCVNKGCVPSKALLEAGELAWEAGHHPLSGLATESRQVDLPAILFHLKLQAPPADSPKRQTAVAGCYFVKASRPCGARCCDECRPQPLFPHRHALIANAVVLFGVVES